MYTDYTPLFCETPVILYEDTHTLCAPAEHPLNHHALEIRVKQERSLEGLTPDALESLWKARQIAQGCFEFKGFEGSLAYSKVERDRPFDIHLVPYGNSRLYSIPVIRSIWSTWNQAIVIYHDTFGARSLSIQEKDAENRFWSSCLDFSHTETSALTGRGNLTKEDVIERQRIFEGESVNVLYNYKPIKAGKEEIHFLFVSKPNCPAKNFSELTKESYVEIMTLIQKVSNILFRNDLASTIFVFDKTGVIAGQTEPICHFHLIATTTHAQEWKGKMHMLFKMIFPTFKLSTEELEKRRVHFSNLLQPLSNETPESN